MIDAGLCTRCGICMGICPENVIFRDLKMFPLLSGDCIECGLCFNCCPGGKVNFKELHQDVFGKQYNEECCLAFVESINLCYAKDKAVRNSGSSGGVVTMLLIYLLEKGLINGAVVVTMDDNDPFAAKGVLAKTTEDIIKASRSKYIVTPSMEVLKEIRKLDGKFAVVGLPCQVHGIRKLTRVDPELAGKIIFILGLMCSYTLEPDSIHRLAQIKKIRNDKINEFEFRGGKWPGNFRFINRSSSENEIVTLSFPFTMNAMFTIFTPLRCFRCYDGINEFADLSFGDFYSDAYRSEYSDKTQRTIVFQKTNIGKIVLEGAVEEGYIDKLVLPENRLSKRIIHMIRKKKKTCITLNKCDASRDIDIPDYGLELLQRYSIRNQILIKFRIISILRKSMIRNLLINMAFSKFGKMIDMLNYRRKKRFAKYMRN